MAIVYSADASLEASGVGQRWRGALILARSIGDIALSDELLSEYAGVDE